MIPKIKLVRHPDTNEIILEEWRDIVDYEGLYQVSNYGRVKSIDRIVSQKSKLGITFKRLMKGHLLKPTINSVKGYLYVSLSKRGKENNTTVHSLVATAFHPIGGTLVEVNHRDCNKQHNLYFNLEWVTHKENMARAAINKRIRSTGRPKLDQDDVLAIRTLFTDTPNSVTAKLFDVGWDAIDNILKYKSWNHNGMLRSL